MLKDTPLNRVHYQGLPFEPVPTEWTKALFCPKCSHKTNNSDNYCSKCGQKFKTNQGY